MSDDNIRTWTRLSIVGTIYFEAGRIDEIPKANGTLGCLALHIFIEDVTNSCCFRKALLWRGLQKAPFERIDR
jgi:hypothetical protein